MKENINMEKVQMKLRKKECSHMNNMEEEKVGTRSHRNLSAT